MKKPNKAPKPESRKIPRQLQKCFTGLLFVLFFLNACTPEYDNPVSSYEQLPPAIFVFLNTLADTQYVIISDANPADSLPAAQVNAELNRLRQAKIRLYTGEQVFSFEREAEYQRDLWGWPSGNLWSAGHGIFMRMSTNAVLPATDYRLEIEIPEKGLFTAATRSPGDFEILTPQPIDTIDVFNPLTVRWQPAEGAAGYRILLSDFREDSSNFKWGYSDEISYYWTHWKCYIKATDNPEAELSHQLSWFYTHPPDYFPTLLKLVLTVEALDEPAWLAYEIARSNNDNHYEFRFEVVAYSNIVNGRGWMSAVTTKTRELAFPKGQN